MYLGSNVLYVGEDLKIMLKHICPKLVSHGPNPNPNRRCNRSCIAVAAARCSYRPSAIRVLPASELGRRFLRKKVWEQKDFDTRREFGA